MTDIEIRGSTTVILANDIQYAVGLLTIRKGLGDNADDPEMNFIIDPAVTAVELDNENNNLDDNDDEISIDRNEHVDQ